MDSTSQQPNSQFPSLQPVTPNDLYKLISIPSSELQFQLGLQGAIIPGMMTQIKKEAEVLANTTNAKPKDLPRAAREKGGRRSDDARTYKCNKCSRSYLSYPALYTHTKLKHMYTGENSSITNGRMRGRPRKFHVLFAPTLDRQWGRKSCPDDSALFPCRGKERRPYSCHL
eukprot:TRINITY_DN2479_c0_g1_i1.p3 TRINITY_DN2479_c0_g1~~TRINITY_DN2479_c0_g1_i1.p3  ORF type:complete len:171 (+),score=21.09 TRINITY_DN2479_c0_g1_i1:163-675(+)